jgi:hypothetical protein
MPEVSISGTKLPRVENVQFAIGLGSADARQLPSVTCTFTIPADNDMTLVNWALAPQGEDRFKKVEIKTFDRSGVLNKTWTFAKAYLAALTETETGSGVHTQTSVTIIGTLIHATTDYDGTNILKVDKGQTETAP